MASSSTAKTPPAKTSSARTYDSKLVSREMHRLGNLAHIPAPLINAAASATSLALPTSSSSISASSASTVSSDQNPWASLHVHVLPLFNGEPLRIPIEDLNTLVKRHIQTVLAASPSKALSTLEQDAFELISSGMVTLNAKLHDIENEKVLGRVVEIWGFFWDQVLPYVEGVLLPLHTEPILASLYRPKPHRPSSPTRASAKAVGLPNRSLNSTGKNLSTPLTNHIDVRTLALCAFRDQVIHPLSPRLLARLSVGVFMENGEYAQPRLQQMLLVLASQGGRPRTPPFSLTAPPPQPTLGEAAITDLLHAVRAPGPRHTNSTFSSSTFSVPYNRTYSQRAPSFLSGGQPRDRRGRIAHKARGGGWASAGDLLRSGRAGDEDGLESYVGSYGDAEATPRVGALAEAEARREQREREFLEGLRSPDVDAGGANSPRFVSMGVGLGVGVGGGVVGGISGHGSGGWGLGAGVEEVGRGEEDDEMDWDQAQAVVEHMVGMKPTDAVGPEGVRRRMT